MLPLEPWRSLGDTLRPARGQAVQRREGGPPRWSGAAALKLRRRGGGGGERGQPGPEREGLAHPWAWSIRWEGTRRMLAPAPWRHLANTLRRDKRGGRRPPALVGRGAPKASGRRTSGRRRERPGAGAGRGSGPSVGLVCLVSVLGDERHSSTPGRSGGYGPHVDDGGA